MEGWGGGDDLMMTINLPLSSLKFVDKVYDQLV